MKINKPDQRLIVLVLTYVVGLLFFALTNPSKLPLVVLIVPFVYIFITLYATIHYMGRRLVLKRTRLIALILSTLGVLLFILGSLHQLTLRDVIISLILSLVMSWYVARVSSHYS